MNKRLAVFGSAVALLAGCGTKEVVVVQAPTPTVETTVPLTAAPVEDPDEDFLDRVQSDTDLAGVIPERTMLEFAATVCEFFSNGGTTDALVQIIYDNGVANDLSQRQMNDFAVMAGIAVDEYCPEYWPLVQA